MAQVAHAVDVDIWEVVEAAATKPFGFQAFWPGPGVGGHCIPLDPQYLAWPARAVHSPTDFIDLAEVVNSGMPAYVAGRIGILLGAHGLPIEGTRVLVVGITYKPNVSDHRESASIEVINCLIDRGASVAVLDPMVPADQITRLGHRAVVQGSDLSEYALAAVLTDHRNVDYAALADSVPLVFDSRGVFRRLGIDRENVITL